MTTDNAVPESDAPAQAQEAGFKKTNLLIIAIVFALLWGMAITSGSVIFMSIVGVLTLLAAGAALWVWRQVRRHRDLANVLQGAASSPEARRAALAKLEADPKSSNLINLIARAQLLAGDDPNAALSLLEPVDLKAVPANMQDDFALLKSQLLLSFGRAKQARPLADWVNLDNPQRKEMRPIMAAIVAETWARTGSARDANTLLDSVNDADASKSDAVAPLLIARVYACFSADKKGLTRSALKELAAIDPNLLGRFITPQSRTHPGLARLAREEFERKAPRAQRTAGNRGRMR